MHKVKDNVQRERSGKITIDPTMNERYGDKVLFQQKIDRLNALLKGPKLDSSSSKIEAKS